MKAFLAFAAVLIAAGCSLKEPADTDNPEASAKWIQHCISRAENANSPQERIAWLRKGFDHAGACKVLSQYEGLAKAPGMAYAHALRTQDREMFKWAIDAGAEPEANYSEMLEAWKLGPEIRDLIVDIEPDSLPFLMNQAIEHHDARFFNQHAEAFKSTGFKVSGPLETATFNIQYRRFIGKELQDALQERNEERIRFLIAQIPVVENRNLLDKHTDQTMRNAGDYVIHELKDEALAISMVELRFALNPIDLETMPFGEAFLSAFRSDPEYAIRTQRLDEWEKGLGSKEAAFLLTLPEEAWRMLDKAHVEEAIEWSIARGDSEGALRLVAFKASRNPLVQADYNRLLNIALTHGDETVFDYVMEHSGKIDLFNISFAALAANQELFERYAPTIMKRIYYQMDTEPRSDGTTLGSIRQVFACGNEDSGLYLLHNYDLSDTWVKATEGRTLLMDVCEAGNLKAARYLIEKKGADIHAQTGYREIQISLFGSTKPIEGKLSSIFFAAQSGNSDLIRYLHAKGANVNARSNYRATPLMHAVSAGQVEAVQTLISLGADVNARMSAELSAINVREARAYEEISTAYRRAQTEGNQQIMEILLKAGAKPSA